MRNLLKLFGREKSIESDHTDRKITINAKLRPVVAAFLALIVMAMSLNQAFADADKTSAAECFKRAEQYEKVAKKHANDVPYPSKWFDLAMKNYLCASKAGIGLASWRALLLSRSGLGKEFPKGVEDSLLLQAAEGDIADAQIVLASDYCDSLGTESLCKNPKEAEKWLLKSARNGSPRGTFSLGYFYEAHLSSDDVATRAIKAIACYKLSLQRYQDAINANGAKDIPQLKWEMELPVMGIERALKILGGKDPLGKCY